MNRTYYKSLFLFLIAPLLACTGSGQSWQESLDRQLDVIEWETEGTLGVYVKHLESGDSFGRNANRLWYQASTIKVPLAIAILMMVEEGVLSLDDRLTLQESDFVDGAGPLLWMDPGTQFTIGRLLELMLADSDSTATDMLIRLIGADELNRRIREDMVQAGFEPFTTIVQVRYDAYSEIHSGVAGLTNMDLVQLRSFSAGDPRYQALLETLGARPDELKAGSIAEAFERYYTRNLNSGTLEAFGLLLEQLHNEAYLNAVHTDMIIQWMEAITTGERRIKAGLPEEVPFAQKTGTQHERACNVGIVHPREVHAVVIAACVEDFGSVGRAEAVFQRLGAALGQAGLLGE